MALKTFFFGYFSLFNLSSHKLDQWHRFTIISLFLPDYECFEENSVYGYEYDPTTGNCTCKAGWFGNKCQGKLKLTTLSQWLEHKGFGNFISG